MILPEHRNHNVAPHALASACNAPVKTSDIALELSVLPRGHSERPVKDAVAECLDETNRCVMVAELWRKQADDPVDLRMNPRPIRTNIQYELHASHGANS